MKRGSPVPKMPGSRHRLSPARQLALSLLAGLGLGVGVIVWMSCQLRPVILAVTQAELSNRVARTAASVLTECIESDGSFQNLVELHYDDSGTLSAVTTRMEQANLLRETLTVSLLDELEAMEDSTVSVPVGTLTGLSVLSGRGWSIPVRVLSVSRVEGQFESALTAAGINQSLHTLELVLETEVVLLLPDGLATQTVTTRLTVAETVLLGQVPDAYTYFSQFDSASDASDAYFDYGADAN
ncbi:MAG: sporulation protein YunB [Clostridiales bacterium]|nr:sporulation protein YunB [Clostridiales bacterium]